MQRSFTYLFDLYNFFSVFLPGLGALMGSYMLIPLEIKVGLSTALIPIFVLAFIFGEALHSFAVFVESVSQRISPIKSHREHFASELSDPTMLDPDIIEQFCSECRQLLGAVDFCGKRSAKTDRYEDFYPLIQSYIYADNRGRSRTYQAIYAFCRSMFLLLLIMPILIILHHEAKGTIVDRDAKYLQFFPTYGEFLEAALPLCLIGTLLFAYGTYKYKRFFVQYLISDFVVIRIASRQEEHNRRSKDPYDRTPDNNYRLDTYLD